MLRFLIKPSGFAPETPAAPSPHWVDELMERFDAGNAGAAAARPTSTPRKEPSR